MSQSQENYIKNLKKGRYLSRIMALMASGSGGNFTKQRRLLLIQGRLLPIA
jgi:hypothetical protein